MPLAEFARRMMAMACKATGMNEYQIREAAAKMGDEILEPPRVQESRQTVCDRGVPEKHIKAIYDREPIECDALRAVRDFLAGDKTTLVLAGGTGTRKSGSACWALTQRPGVFVTEDEVLRLYASRAPEDIESWRRIRQAQVLVVDDIGEYSDDKGWGVKVITGLWNHRYSSELKLIVTVNKTPAEFKAEFGERIVDRVRESGRFVELGGQSVRGGNRDTPRAHESASSTPSSRRMVHRVR
jgi:hypothetical protein